MLKRDELQTLFESKFLNVYDVRPGDKPYYNASRRKAEDLPVLMSDDERKSMVADAVSCVVVLNVEGKEPLLVMNQEFRFPIGQFVLSVPAGLIDKSDKVKEQPVFSAAIRELKEETGLDFEDTDTIEMVNPLLFSTPGMTDESNAIVQITLNRKSMPGLTQDGAEETELFDGFKLLTKEEASKILKAGRDEDGFYYSVFTWIGLVCFVSGLWN